MRSRRVQVASRPEPAAARPRSRDLHPTVAAHLRAADIDPRTGATGGTFRLLLSMLCEDYEAMDAERLEHARLVGEGGSRRRRSSRPRRADDRLQVVFDAAPVGLIRMAVDGRIEDVNPVALALLGRDLRDLAGADVHTLLHPDERDRFRSDLADLLAGEPLLPKQDYRWKGAGGAELVTETTLGTGVGGDGAPTVIALVEDASERRALHRELRDAQKLEAIGRLAAGIAHEINTPIQFVGGTVRFLSDAATALAAYAEAVAPLVDAAAGVPGLEELAAAAATAREELDLGFFASELPQATEQGLAGVERVATIVRAVKGFSHLGTERAEADLNEIIQQAVTLSHSATKAVADVRVDLRPLPPVRCSAGDLSQVFLNLIVNAADAIAEKVGDSGERGTIEIRSWREGAAVTVELVDDGAGIPEEVRDRIFDPFFTTKPKGKGTGQGLALARTVIESQHGGIITVDSVRGRGAQFLISLPVETTP
jgi:PAS domain S-box-containing protein